MFKNKKGAEFVFAKIIGILIVLVVIIWALFYYAGLGDKLNAIAERFLG